MQIPKLYNIYKDSCVFNTQINGQWKINLLLCDQKGAELILSWSLCALCSIPQIGHFLAVLEPLPASTIPITSYKFQQKSKTKKWISVSATKIQNLSAKSKISRIKYAFLLTKSGFWFPNVRVSVSNLPQTSIVIWKIHTFVWLGKKHL